MNVAIVGTVGVPAKYGGFETLVHQLVKWNKSNIHFTVYCSAKAYKKADRLPYFHNAELIYLPFSSNGLWSIAYDVVSIVHALFKARTILILGVSGVIILPLLTFFCRDHKFIVHIDGLEWKRNKWGKLSKYFLKKSEALAVKYAHRIIADNKAIQEYVHTEYGTNSTLIAYGADHIFSATPIDPCRGFVLESNSYAFSVCRIEPENNVHIILEAFSNLPSRNLKFVGNWQNSSYGKELFKKYSLFSNIELLAPIYDQEKLDEIRSNCLYYIHGHSAGGTNPSLVEAMFLSLPVISFDVSYNRETTEQKAIYFSTVDELFTTIKHIHNFPLAKCANELKMIADLRYNWNKISSEYIKLIEGVQQTSKVISVFPVLKTIGATSAKKS